MGLVYAVAGSWTASSPSRRMVAASSPSMAPNTLTSGGRPAASPTRAGRSGSEVRPWVRPRIPSPPPRVRPAIPTPGPQPAGMVRPCLASASYTSPSRAPAPIVATPSATDTDRIGVTSMTIPALDERPAKQWPPLRGTAWRPDRRATARASATSPAVAQNTTARGRAPPEPATAGMARASLAGDMSVLTAAGLTAAGGWPHEDTADGLGMIVKTGEPLSWLVVAGGAVIGDCGLHGGTHGPVDEAGRVEIGYGLAAPSRGQGYGSEGVGASTEWLPA